MPARKKTVRTLRLKRQSFPQWLVVAGLLLIVLGVMVVSYLVQQSNLTTGSKAAQRTRRLGLPNARYTDCRTAFEEKMKPLFDNQIPPTVSDFENKYVDNGKQAPNPFSCPEGQDYPYADANFHGPNSAPAQLTGVTCCLNKTYAGTGMLEGLAMLGVTYTGDKNNPFTKNIVKSQQETPQTCVNYGTPDRVRVKCGPKDKESTYFEKCGDGYIRTVKVLCGDPRVDEGKNDSCYFTCKKTDGSFVDCKDQTGTCLALPKPKPSNTPTPYPISKTIKVCADPYVCYSFDELSMNAVSETTDPAKVFKTNQGAKGNYYTVMLDGKEKIVYRKESKNQLCSKSLGGIVTDGLCTTK